MSNKPHLRPNGLVGRFGKLPDPYIHVRPVYKKDLRTYREDLQEKRAEVQRAG